MEEVRVRVEDPWELDRERVRDAIIGRDISVYDIAGKEVFDVTLAFPPGIWRSGNPMRSAEVLSGTCTVKLCSEIPTSFMRSRAPLLSLWAGLGRPTTF